MKVSTVVAAALGLMVLASTASADYHNPGGYTDREWREQRFRNNWIDNERARQNMEAERREQEQLMKRLVAPKMGGGNEWTPLSVEETLRRIRRRYQ